jgi:small subunit ribosomal protein S9
MTTAFEDLTHSSDTYAAPRVPQRDAKGRAYGTGRRKAASARVWVFRGTGKVTVNGVPLDTYFGRLALRRVVAQPSEAIGVVGQFDVYATVKGGGLSGQAGALRHGIARAFDHFDPDLFHTHLRAAGLITRDARVVERKKYGRRKARRRFQYSKR